jgi:hypothetical protein
MQVGSRVAPYPLMTSRPQKSAPYTHTTSCGQPKTLAERYATSSGKLKFRVLAARQPGARLVICVMPSCAPPSSCQSGPCSSCSLQ